MHILNKKGNVLLFAIVAMTTITVVGTGIYFMTTTSIFSGLDANAQNRAYHLAVAGKDYALTKNLGNTAGTTFTFTNGDKFRLIIVGDTITSTGIVKEGTPYEARRALSVTKSGFSSAADISFIKDIAAFDSGKRESQTGFVDVNQTAGRISLGQFQPSQFGSVWYAGGATQGNCQNGKCDFRTGFRIYFIFKLERYLTDIPHGFTFAIFNGTDNSRTSAGGDITMPELLAYGGNSCLGRELPSGNCNGGYVDPNPDVSKKGIQAPKMAIEFDGQQNCCNLSSCTLGSCKTDVCNTDVISNSRSDGERNHLAYVFWGDNTTTCSNKENSLTYDDNKHGAGDSSDPGAGPINSFISSDSSETNDYFTGLAPDPDWTPDWLYSTAKVYAVRIEVTRASQDHNNKYFYTINTWIKRCDSEDVTNQISCSEYIGLSNTKIAYEPEKETPPRTADPPTLKRTIELNKTHHDKFAKFLFGWTAAADAQSRGKLTLNNFQLNFIKDSVDCGGYDIVNNIGNIGTTSYFQIDGTNCKGVVRDSSIGYIGPNGTIKRFTDSSCTIPSSELTYSQAAAADANKNCEVFFSGTDK